MENFYKITKIEANLISRFEYANNQSFDPFCGEQIDGNYLVSEEMYNLLKDSSQFKKINWAGKILISKENLDTKVLTF